MFGTNTITVVHYFTFNFFQSFQTPIPEQSVGQNRAFYLTYLMYIRNILISGLAAASTVQAYNNDTFGEDEKWIVADPPPVQKRQFINVFGLLSNIFGGGGGNNDDPSECPAIWTQISATLTQQFSANGECTDAARAAIRAAFHDCFPGACDGSLILANECAQAPSRGLQRFCSNLAGVASQTNVGVGDLIQFAAAHAVKTCPEGPTVPIRIGRQDSSRENDWRILPRGDARGNDVVRLFSEFPSKQYILRNTF